MAKELPFFKFEPNQWENGNIQMCSRENKGLFIDICSMYWSRLGDLPLKLAIQKLCVGNATAFDSLIQDKIFSIKDGFICIDFLNEQLSEFENTSEQNSKNALLGWEKRRLSKTSSENNATASIPQCENNAIREEEIREEKKINTSLVDWEKLVIKFNEITGKKTRIVNDKTRKQILARLKEGYSKLDLQEAIENCFKDKYHIETNHDYLTLEFISRSDKMEKYSSIKEKRK